MIEYLYYLIGYVVLIIGLLIVIHIANKTPYDKGDCVTYYDGTYLVRASVEYCIICCIKSRLKYILILDNDKIIYSDQVLEND